jgi:3-methyladenine DNA glycosylase Tag
MSAPVSFAPIMEAATIRHGRAAIEARLAAPKSALELEATGDDRYLSLMSLRIFRAGLKHSLVDAKWPAFEEVFQGFDPGTCAGLSDEAIEDLLGDRRLIRNLPKLRAVRANAAAILQVRAEHGSFGTFIARWPENQVVELWGELQERFQQLGGASAAVFLRMAGKDTFLLTPNVVTALNGWGAYGGQPRSKADLRAVQAIFERWHDATGLPLAHLSQVLAMSVD